MMKILEENIPAELKALPQWVCWKYGTRKGKLTKIPKNPRTGGRASHSDPRTWGSYTGALATMAKFRFDGLGFVFADTDPYAGVDIDKCINPETGQVEPWAQRWVDHFDSYTERSPSGTGLHIIIRGEFPGDGYNPPNNPYEAYCRNRFFTFTGDVLEKPHAD